jgi:hypothetical protein
MKKSTAIHSVSGLLALLLAMSTAQARDAVLMIQGTVLAPSCDSQALSTAMTARQSALNGQDCGLAVSTGNAASMTVASVREVQVSSGTDANAVKKMVILTYH